MQERACWNKQPSKSQETMGSWSKDALAPGKFRAGQQGYAVIINYALGLGCLSEVSFTTFRGLKETSKYSALWFPQDGRLWENFLGCPTLLAISFSHCVHKTKIIWKIMLGDLELSHFWIFKLRNVKDWPCLFMLTLRFTKTWDVLLISWFSCHLGGHRLNQISSVSAINWICFQSTMLLHSLSWIWY